MKVYKADGYSKFRVDRRKLPDFINPLKLRLDSRNNHDLTVVRMPVKAGVGQIVIVGAVIFYPIFILTFFKSSISEFHSEGEDWAS